MANTWCGLIVDCFLALVQRKYTERAVYTLSNWILHPSVSGWKTAVFYNNAPRNSNSHSAFLNDDRLWSTRRIQDSATGYQDFKTLLFIYSEMCISRYGLARDGHDRRLRYSKLNLYSQGSVRRLGPFLFYTNSKRAANNRL